MAKKILLKSEVPLNGINYPKGKEISVSDSIAANLLGAGKAELVISTGASKGKEQ